jgi:hypothetical protein
MTICPRAMSVSRRVDLFDDRDVGKKLYRQDIVKRGDEKRDKIAVPTEKALYGTQILIKPTDALVIAGLDPAIHFPKTMDSGSSGTSCPCLE